MRRNKLAWVLLAGVLCLALYTLVIMRSESKATVILGGIDGAPPRTQRETAKLCSNSRSYVSRLEKHALSKLRRALEAQ